jgi:hypothetical protein
MHHPVFENFEIFTSNEISPEFHYGFLGEVTRKSFDDGILAVLGKPTAVYAPGQIRKGYYPQLNEEYFEWIDVLETVIAAIGSFTVIELGAGLLEACASTKFRGKARFVSARFVSESILSSASKPPSLQGFSVSKTASPAQGERTAAKVAPISDSDPFGAERFGM